VKAARKRGLKVALYTVKSKSNMKKAMKHHPDMIFIDDMDLPGRYLH
jgi:glycerophosphoryl diester phosphodiesterase